MKHNQIQADHEEIVQGLTNSLNEGSQRAQQAEVCFIYNTVTSDIFTLPYFVSFNYYHCKLQVALLEARRDLVVIKYQQQANFIQNTIHRMPYLP